MNKPTRTAAIAAATIALCLAAPLHAQNSGDETVIDGVAAVVGKNIVRYSDIERTYAQVRMRQGIADAQKNRCAILENLIVNQLLIHKAEVDSIEVTDDQISSTVQEYLRNDMQQYGTREALREATGFSYEELKEQYEHLIRNMYMAYQAQMKITEEIGITPHEVSEFYNKIPTDSLPIVAERYELSEIVIEPTIDEAERERVRTQLAELRERVIKGEKFAMLATLYSQDPGSATKGGETGFFGRGRMVGEFESAAFALKPGEVSPIIETQYGFHILQLIERRGNTVNVRHILIAPKVSADDMLSTRMRLDSIADEIRAGNISFDEAARRYSTATNARQGGVAINPTDGTQRFDRAALDQHYYGVGIQNMSEGQVSAASAMKTEDNRDAYRIVRLNKRMPEHHANLSDDYDYIYNAALNEAKQTRMAEWARRQSGITYIRLSNQYKDCQFENIKH